MSTEPKLDPATGHYHFKLSSGRSFGLRKPKLSDMKVAAQLAGRSTGNEVYDSIVLGEQLAVLLLTQVDEKAVTFESVTAAGGLEGLFPELADCEDVMRAVGQIRRGDFPLERKGKN